MPCCKDGDLIFVCEVHPLKSIIIGDGEERREYFLPDSAVDKIEREIAAASTGKRAKSQKAAESSALLEHFLKAFSSAYTVNLEEDSFEILHMAHDFRHVFTMDGTRKDMESFIERHIHPDDRAMLRQLTDNNYLRERLKSESEISFTIREQYGGCERTMHVTIVRTTDADHAVVGFMDVSAEVAREKAGNEKIEEAYRAMENYRQALLSHALIYIKANLTADTVVDGVWVDDAGRQLFLRDILGLDLPCSYDEYIALWNGKFVSRASRQEFARLTDRRGLLLEFEKGNTEISFVYKAKSISGTRKYLRRVINLARDIRTGDVISYTSVKDVTQEKLKDEELLKQAQVINKLADGYSDIYLVDVKSRGVQFIRVSGRIGEASGNQGVNVPYDEAIGGYIERNVVPDDRARMLDATRFETVCEKLGAAPEYAHHYRANIQGESHYCRMKAVRLGGAGSFRRIVVGFAIEDEERRKEIMLREAMLAAQNANQAKSTFLFNMSHDIRTPMNAILGFAAMAQKHIDEKGRVADCLKKVLASGRHLLSLINDVLDMSRVESGKAELNEETLCVDTCLDHLLSISSANAAERGLALSTHLGTSVTHHWVSLDRVKLMRVLSNLLSNSIKYTESGGKIDVTLDELPCDKEGWAMFRCVIADTGIGMGPDFLRHVFDPFAREKNTTKSGVVGTGLGMAITKSLVELMGGAISIESELGKGTVVTLEMAHRIVEPPKFKEETRSIDTSALCGKSVLLVEDNALNREIALEILEEEGLVVDVAEDGDVAVEKVRKSPAGTYDLILMDVQMPKMNGYEATRAIRALPDPGCSSIPIVAMTANAFEEDRRNAFEAGMNGHIAKPVDVKVLFGVLSKMFATR